jgi:hypothetical protein
MRTKVLLVNGSPHKEGCTYTALTEVAKTLNEEGIDTEIFWIGIKPLAGCIACKKCAKTGRCAFDDHVNDFLDIAKMLMALFLGLRCIMLQQVVRLHPSWIAFFMPTCSLANNLFT